MPRSPKSEKPARKVTRPPLERIQRIHRALVENEFPNCSVLAARLEVSTKTIQRDIDFMRDRQALPIAFDQRRNGFYYTEPVESLPSIQVSEGEVVALYVAQKVLAQYAGTPFEKPLAAAFAKLTAGLQDSISFPLASLDDSISIRAPGGAEADIETFEALHKAVSEREEVVIGYKSLADARERSRWVQPYHLLGASGSWYLIGIDKERSAFRVYSLPRIRSVRRIGIRFERITDFDPGHLLQGSLGVFIGKESHQIRIRFDSFAAQLVKERQWHESQVIKDLPGEEVELSMTLNSLFEIERWILSWGPHATVLEPKELRDQILAKAEAIVGAYAGKKFAGNGIFGTQWEHVGPPDMAMETTDPRRRSES